MGDVIGNLAYRVKFDATQLHRGLLTTRQEMSQARRITDSMRPAIDSYTNGMVNLDSMLRKGLITASQHAVAQQQLQRQMLESEATTRRLNVAEMDQLKSLRAASAGIKTTAQDEANRAKQMSRAREIIEQTRSSQDRMNRSLAEARQLYRSGAIDAATYAKHVAQIKQEHAKPGLLGKAGASFKGTLGAIGAAAGVTSLVGTGKDAIMMTANIEKAQAAMEGFTGSVAAADAIMGDMRKLSSAAGISMLKLSDGAAGMMGYGVTAQETSKKLRQFAEISRGDSERMRSLALAFGQVNAAGRLMGQEVLQMVNAGFNPLQEIARTTGIEFATLKKMMENGQITVDMVSKSFETATSAGGRFFGMLDKNMETSSGALNRLSSEWDRFLDALGKSPPTNKVAGFFTNTLGNLTTGLEMYGSAKDQANAQTELIDASRRNKGSGLSNKLTKETERERELDVRIRNQPFYREAAEHDKRMAAIREAKAKQEADRKAKEQQRREQLDSVRAMQQQAMLDAQQERNPEAFKRFGQITELIKDEPKKKMATEDFARFGNINRILPLLERELQLELAKVDALNQQNAARQGRPVEKNPMDLRTPPGPMQPRTFQQPSLMQQPKLKQQPGMAGMMQQPKPAPATTAGGLTRAQHELNSYASQAHAMAAEQQLRQAEMMQRQQMMIPQMQQQVQQLPAVETRLDQQIKAHSPVASIQQGSAAAYDLMVKNKTRGDVKNDPNVKELRNQTSQLKEIKEYLRELSGKLDFEPV